MATAAIPLVLQGIKTLEGIFLGQHLARLKDAVDENRALDALVPAFDQDLQQMAAAYNTGQATADECMAALVSFDQQTFTYLRAQVGKAGTAWGGPTTQALGASINPKYEQPCDKSCTAGCCVYLNVLRPAIYGRKLISGDNIVGMLQVLREGGTGVVHVGTIYPPPRASYGNYSRAGYDIALQTPPPQKQIATAVNKLAYSIDSVLGIETPGTQGTSPQFSVGGMSGSLTGFALLAGAFIIAVLLAARISK